MQLARLCILFVTAALLIVHTLAHSASAPIGETLLLIPTRGAAVIVIENASRFDPLVQRLLAEGEIKRWFVVEQPLIQLPKLQSEGFLHELQIRQLDEIMRR